MATAYTVHANGGIVGGTDNSKGVRAGLCGNNTSNVSSVTKAIVWVIIGLRSVAACVVIAYKVIPE